MTPILSAADLAAVRGLPRAMVFLYVSWSTQARQSRARVQDLDRQWRQEHPDRPAPAFIADLSDGEGEVWDAVRAWLGAERQDVGLLTIGGSGALIWVHGGRIAVAIPSLVSLTVPTLFASTGSIFAGD